jgi:hypothetical protein
MEPVSFAVGIAGLAGLFSTCLDVIEKAKMYRDFGSEHSLISTKYKADKVMFQLWAQKVGIGKLGPQDARHNHLDNPEIATIVQMILLSIKDIFTKSEGDLSKIQLISEHDANGFFEFGNDLDEYNAQTLGLQAVVVSKRHRLRWAFGGKDKSIERAQMFSDMVSKLYSLVPPEDRDSLSSRYQSTSYARGA